MIQALTMFHSLAKYESLSPHYTPKTVSLIIPILQVREWRYRDFVLCPRCQESDRVDLKPRRDHLTFSAEHRKNCDPMQQ